MIIRHPTAAGLYYPRDKESLEQTIDAIDRRVRTTKRTVLGAVVPHSGIIYCGETQAHVYKSFAGSPIVVVVGANHQRAGAPYAIMSQGVWATPLGKTRIDTQLAEAIKNKAPSLKEDVSTFSQDHSIETQLPWIQKFLRTEFVPISVYGDDLRAWREIGSAIRDAAHETGRAVSVVASSDMTRYGEALGFVPVRGTPSEIVEWIRATDESVIKAIQAFDIEALLKAIASTNVCGVGAIAAMLYSTMEVAQSVTTVHYDTTYDLTRSTAAITSFAGLVVE